MAVMAVPGATDQEVVALDSLGLRPSVRVVREKHPFDGPLVLRVDRVDRTLGSTVARQILVTRDTQPA
jgi:Fe2+ transport system protein FeoA